VWPGTPTASKFIFLVFSVPHVEPSISECDIWMNFYFYFRIFFFFFIFFNFLVQWDPWIWWRVKLGKRMSGLRIILVECMWLRFYVLFLILALLKFTSPRCLLLLFVLEKWESRAYLGDRTWSAPFFLSCFGWAVFSFCLFIFYFWAI
jgi:hypothetical protein